MRRNGRNVSGCGCGLFISACARACWYSERIVFCEAVLGSSSCEGAPRTNFLVSASAKNVIRTPSAGPARIIHATFVRVAVAWKFKRKHSKELTVTNTNQPELCHRHRLPSSLQLCVVLCAVLCFFLHYVEIVQCLQRSEEAHVRATVFYVNRWPFSLRYRNGNFWSLLFLRPNMHNMQHSGEWSCKAIRRWSQKFRKQTRKTSHIVYDSRWLSHSWLSLSSSPNGRPKQFGLMLQLDAEQKTNTYA